MLAVAELAAIVALGVNRFRAESVLQRAAERLLEIIGEAANAIGPNTRAMLADVAWTDITRPRILLAHHYHRVDAELHEPAKVVERALRIVEDNVHALHQGARP